MMNLNRIYISEDSIAHSVSLEKGRKRLLSFPLSLAMKQKKSTPEIHRDFILSTCKGRLFVKTNSPLPVGSRLKVHVFIPPAAKLLGEFRAKVVDANTTDDHSPGGMKLQLLHYSHKGMERLENYLEGKNSLIDLKA